WMPITASGFYDIGPLAFWNEDGSAPLDGSIYVGGYNFLARLDGDQLNSVSRIDGTIDALTTLSTGHSRSVLVAGGTFEIPNSSVKGLAQWNGQEWSTVGQQIAPYQGMGPAIWHMIAFDAHGNGANLAKLYVSGVFSIPGSRSIHNLACWDGV